MSVTLILVILSSCTLASPVAKLTAQFEDAIELEQSRYLLTMNNETGNVEYVDLLALDVTYQADGQEVSFHLYTNNNFYDDEVVSPLTIENSKYFDRSKDTVFVIHGWRDDYQSELNGLIRDALLNISDINVIVVDWSPAAKCNYITAMLAVEPVGKSVGHFINTLISENKMRVKQFGIVGHSLGAHVSGNAGAAVDGLIDFIVGLDPAGPLFSYSYTDNRLDPSDAKYVQIIHTSFWLGLHKPIGHSDFFPNGGMHQPGCGLDLINTCAHSRSYEYFAESLINPRFLARQCTSYEDFVAGKCSHSKVAIMGQVESPKRPRGTYYLQTRAEEPYAI